MKRLLKNRILYHTIFWMVCFFILFQLFTKEYYNGAIDFIYTGLFLLPMIVIVYINRWLINKFITKANYVVYGLGFVLLALLGVGLHYFAYDVLSDLIFKGYYLSSYYGFLELVQYNSIFLLASTLFKLAKDWFIVKDRELDLVQENHTVKLNALKSQVNPHFLFNSLNNIYSLSNDSPGAVRNYILKLSDALRYMIYDTDQEQVVLDDELSYLSDYISLEKLRLKKSDRVTFKFPERTSELIAPMILLPLIENCFKYVDKVDPFIHISISLDCTELELRTANNCTAVQKEQSGGLGLKNLRKRLDLLYPNRHQYSSIIEEGIYQASLSLNLAP